MTEQREIKFMAWDRLRKTMFGPFTITEYAEDFVKLLHGPCLGLKYDCKFPDLGRDSVSVMQYTGLKDKNGKEIYEGDIVRDRKGIGEVQFYDCHPYAQFGVQHHDFETYFDGSDTWWSDEIPEECEVIGNIYENPDMLEK